MLWIILYIWWEIKGYAYKWIGESANKSWPVISATDDLIFCIDMYIYQKLQNGEKCLILNLASVWVKGLKGKVNSGHLQIREP
jgi:hypothetical protein